MFTFDDVMEWALEMFPDATLGEDEEGQLVIYTDFVEVNKPKGHYVPRCEEE